MSIINDALKRAQERMKSGSKEAPEKNSSVQDLTREQKPPSIHPPRKPKAEAKKSSHKKKKMWYQTVTALVVLFFFITGILLATLFFLMKRSSSDADPTATIRREYMPKLGKRNFKPGELVLSGTSIVEDKTVALINGGIYESGEIVEGYRITSITMKQVELQNLRGDSSIILKVNGNP